VRILTDLRSGPPPDPERGQIGRLLLKPRA
jgi:hypothetical protein